MAPFFLGVIWLLYKKKILSDMRTFCVVVVIVVAVVASLVLTVGYTGLGISGAICDSLIVRGVHPTICTGGIRALDDSAMAALSYNYEINIQSGLWLSFAIAAVLAAIPFYFFRFNDWVSLSPIPWNWAIIILFIVFAPIFLVGIDWGRWIHVVVSGSSIILALLIHLGAVKAVPLLPSVMSVIYLSTWHVPHCCGALGGGLVAKVLGWLMRNL